MCQQKKYNEEDFDYKKAFNGLNVKYIELAKILKEIMSVETKDFRSHSSVDLNERLSWIIGGEEVEEGEFQECCLVGRYDRGNLEWLCTGVLLDKRLVITAGHCYTPYLKYEVALNAVSIDGLGRSERIRVKKAVLHPDYGRRGNLNDLAVLILDKDSKVDPVSVASTEEIINSKEVQIVGFGNNDYGGGIGFGIKRQVTVPIRSIRRNKNDNLNSDESDFGFESDIEFVAGGAGYDSCTGDSGGPSYIYVDGVKKVAGITSRAIDTRKYTCGNGGIYTRLDMYEDFIMKTYEKNT